MHTLHLSRSAGTHVLAVGLAILIAMPPAWALAADDAPPLSKEQLEQLVAPIALYPDSLLAQVLMASTYPLEVVEAARWVRDHDDIEGKALAEAVEKESWDASVKSLAAFPQTLDMMNDKLDWTTQLGNAFLAQQNEIMDSVQVLRQRAKDAGNLQSNDEQVVKVENAPTGNQTQTIIVEPANPQVVYVPTYNPTVVYGTWPYPAYRPFYWYPPGYAFVGSAISFGVGLAVGSALWGGCNWGRSNVNINVNKYNNFNKTNIKNSNWQHNGEHRKGVAYRDQSTRNKFGGDSARDQRARDQFRGRAEQGRQQISRGDANKFKGQKPSARGEIGANRSGTRQNAQGPSRSSAGHGNRSGGAFQGSGNGRDTRRNSDRGRASRSSSFSRGGGGGGGRSFGGSRGGGGRGGGGRRGR